MDIYLPPKPALIIPKPAAIIRPGDPRFTPSVQEAMLGWLGIGALCGGGGGLSGYTPPSTSYANAGGSGNRAGVVTVTINTFTLGGGSAAAFVDGTTTGGQGFWFSGSLSAGNIVFDFGVGAAKYIDEFKLYQSSTPTAQGSSWNFDGSNDGSSWTLVTAIASAIGGSATTTYSTPHVSPAAWRYYRLLLASGSVNATAWNNEIEFKIG